MTSKFFEEQSSQSLVKAEIIEKYFAVWAKIIGSAVKRSSMERLAYIDLFAGPGRYKDGSSSVPIRVLELAISDPFLREHLATLFNDKDETHVAQLEKAIASLPDISKLKHKPILVSSPIDKQVTAHLELSKRNVPTFTFIDPWGYKGLSLKLVNSVISEWGCDCVFFFNYSRVNAGISNEFVDEHIDALFTSERANRLRSMVEGARPALRESLVIEHLSEALLEMKANYVLPFCFKNESGSRTSHYLIFVTKSFKGYDIMKQVMSKASSQSNQSVGSFHYCPADESMPYLFEFLKPLSSMRSKILEQRGWKGSFQDFYERFSPNTPFLMRHFRQVLLELEAEGLISVEGRRPARTLAPNRIFSINRSE